MRRFKVSRARCYNEKEEEISVKLFINFPPSSVLFVYIIELVGVEKGSTQKTLRELNTFAFDILKERHSTIVLLRRMNICLKVSK
jgi:hypothetical protein